MTDGVPIPLERYVLEKVAELEARVELRREATKEALALQAKEYERRLTDLNHAHALALQDKGTFATKEATERELRVLVERIGKLEIAKADRDGTARIVWAMWGFAAAAAIAVLVFLLNKA